MQLSGPLSCKAAVTYLMHWPKVLSVVQDLSGKLADQGPPVILELACIWSRCCFLVQVDNLVRRQNLFWEDPITMAPYFSENWSLHRIERRSTLWPSPSPTPFPGQAVPFNSRISGMSLSPSIASEIVVSMWYVNHLLLS